MPYKVCWVFFHFLQAGLALDALTTARGIGLAFADQESGGDAVGDAFTQAYPRRR